MNHTFVALIPKKPDPNIIQEYRPISLCNVTYKLVIKVICNRLKPFLPNIIADTQSASTQGRLITDNILIAFKILHAMKANRHANGDLAVKLDMATTFDKVEWPFLLTIILRLGFSNKWAELVMRCVKFASFSFLVNVVPGGTLFLVEDFAKKT